MHTEAHIVAAEADVIALEMRLARVEREHRELARSVELLLLALVGEAPIVRPDGARVTFRAEPAPHVEPAP